MGWNGMWKTKGRPSEARLKFFDETFLQKSFDLALDLHRRAAQERKLGKQRSVFPDRQRSCPLSHGCRRASVSAAASVGRWATSHRDVAAPEGEPSKQPTRGLQKA